MIDSMRFRFFFFKFFPDNMMINKPPISIDVYRRAAAAADD